MRSVSVSGLMGERKEREARKHVATTSPTLASLHMGKCASMQYCRLQSPQLPARNSFLSSFPFFPSSPPPLLPPAPLPSSWLRVCKRSRDTKCCCWCDEARGAFSGMMVLLEKHVHLQNKVGARYGRFNERYIHVRGDRRVIG